MGFTAGYKVNEGTDYEFTVSDETISEVVLDTGITESDIADYCYSALIDSRIETVKAESHTDVQQPGWASWCQDHAMFYYINNTRYIKSNVGINNTSDTVYERNFLIWFGTIYPGEPEEKSGWFLIMDIKDIKRFYVDFSNAGFGQTTVTSTRTDSGVTTPFPGYSGDAYTYNSSLANVYPDIYTDDDQLTTIRVINVLNINDELWVGRLNPSNYGEATTAYSTYGYSMYIDYKLTGWLSASDNEHFFQKGTINWAGIPKIIDMDYPDLGFDVSPDIRTYAESTDDMILDISAQHYGGFPVVTYAVPACKTLNGILKWMSWCGLLFKYGGTTYKPIIESGVIVGFSSNMFAPSEFDTMTNVTGNNISPTPPGPSPSPTPWDVDPETYGWSGGEVSGMVKYYLLTAGQMSSLQSAMASNANWTIDYLNCIVSCFVVPNSGIFFDAPISTTVKFKLDNATEWDTGVGCSRIQGTKNKSGGTIEIPRLTNTFYDFEPYSDYSIYIPFCGRIPIKGNLCLGREIKVTYYPDVPTCTLTAVVSCGGATIAIAKGSFGTMTPVTSNGSDRKTSAVIGDVAPIITGIGTGIVGVALGNPLIVGAGAAQALGGIMGGVKETVQSYAYSVGSTGDSSFFGAGNRCFYYANYPIIDEVVNNSMFGHSVGYLCNTVGKLSSFTGFTICANPHVTFSASSEEREEIERLLSMGVIL